MQNQWAKSQSKKYLMSKKLMVRVNKWNTFETYPAQGDDIILHIRGYQIRENKYNHDFIHIQGFDASSFDKRDYTPNISSVAWSYSWLPTESLMR